MTGFEQDSEAWAAALRLLSRGASIDSSFYQCIRALNSVQLGSFDLSRHLQGSSSAATFLVRRFLSSPTIRCSLYFATQTFRQQQMANREQISAEELVALYSSRELASVLSLLYLSRLFRKGMDAEESPKFMENLQRAADISGHFGIQFPSLGMAESLAIVGMRFICQAIFMRSDLKAFKVYRRTIKQKGLAYDLQQELTNWDCTHAHLTSLLLQRIGYGKDFSEAVFRALSASNDETLDALPNAYRIICRWSEALVLGLKPPTLPGENDHFADDASVNSFVDSVAAIIDNGSRYSWLSRSAADLEQIDAPKLIWTGSNLTAPTAKPAKSRSNVGAVSGGKAEARDAGMSAEAPSEADLELSEFSIPYDELPESIRAHFSAEEFVALREEIQGLLKE